VVGPKAETSNSAGAVMGWRAIVLAVLMAIWQMTFSVQSAAAEHPEHDTVRRVIEDSIGWAMTKDIDRLYQIFAEDDDLLIWWVGSTGGADGIDELRQTAETVWMSDDFTATRFEFRDVRIRFSQEGDVAWFSCRLDDCGVWKGEEFCVADVRNTGVLEKRDGQWTIVQSHASWPVDRIPEDVWSRLAKARAEPSDQP
jgi:ketosteroid isomerase-like protein